MKKTLLVLASLLMAIGSFAEEVTFDFINNGLTMFDGITAVSSTNDHSGDFTEDKTTVIDGVSLTVSPSTTKDANRFWAWDNGSQLRVYGGSFKVSATKTISKIEFVQPTKSAKWTEPTVSAGSIEAGVWTGSATEVTFTVNGQCRINQMIVTLGEGSTEPDEPQVTYTDVASVADLLANYTENTTNLNLKLNNAKVVYVNEYNGTVNAYVRENGSAIELRTLGIDAPVNSVLDGSVKCDLVYSYGVPYLKRNVGTSADELTVTESTEAAAPVSASAADIVALKYLNDLVSVGNLTFSKDEYETGKYNYYGTDGDSKIMIYDKFSKVGGVADLVEGQVYTVVGIFGAIFKGNAEIMPVQSVTATTGVEEVNAEKTNVNAPVYNLAGQRVNANAKGILIQNGKKFVK